MDKPFAITLDVGSSLANKTGSWREERPVYVHRMPPCNHGCPAGENIQQWLYHAESGDYEAAWRELVKDNPLPAVMGRVCYHPCETACNRAQVDDAVGIHGVERFLGDEAIRQGWQLTVDAAPTGKRVLVVGAGPSGLSAAYHLARRGHEVTIRDAGPLAGGMMRFGIPQSACHATSSTPRCSGSSTSASRSNWTPRSRTSWRRCVTGLRRGVSGRRSAHRQARIHPRRGGRAHPRCRHAAGKHGGAGAPIARPARGRLRRRKHRDGCRTHRQAPGRK